MWRHLFCSQFKFLRLPLMSDTIPTRVADRARWLQHNWQDFTQMLGLLPQLGDSWPAINYNYPLTASGVWLVISYTGTDQEQLRRFRRQWVRLMQSRPMPRIFLTEAQFATEPFQLESCAADCSKYGGHYAKLRLGNNSRGIELREALWDWTVREHWFNGGRDLETLVFLDSRCWFSDPGWVLTVQETALDYPWFCPFSACLTVGEQPDKLVPSIGYQLAHQGSLRRSEAGGAFACTKEGWSKLGGLKQTAIGGGDCLRWCQLLGESLANRLKYSPVLSRTVRPYVLTDTKVGYADNLLQQWPLLPQQRSGRITKIIKYRTWLQQHELFSELDWDQRGLPYWQDEELRDVLLK